MSGTWARLSLLYQRSDECVGRQIEEIYKQRNFPIEVRGFFADWFEGEDWEFNENFSKNADHDQELLSSLLSKLEATCSQHHDDLLKQMSHISIKNKFYQVFGGRAQLFVSTVLDILGQEKQLIRSVDHTVLEQELCTNVTSAMINTSTSQQSPTSCDDTNISCDQEQQKEDLEYVTKKQILTNLRNLQTNVQAVDAVIKQYRNIQEDYVLEYQGIQRLDSDIQNTAVQPESSQRDQKLQQLTKRKIETENMLQLKEDGLVDRRKEILTYLCKMETMAHNSSFQILNELLKWKVMLQKSLSGCPFKPGLLDEIQGWLELLSDILQHFYGLVSHFKKLFDFLLITNSDNERKMIDNLLQTIGIHLTKLIQESFVVEKQPPQVLKTQTKFQASIRLLLGAKDFQMNCPEVSVCILNEEQCKELYNGIKSPEEIGNCGEILNGNCVMEHNADKTSIQAEFKNLQLKKIQRQDRKSQESVLEAKYGLIFSANLNVCGNPIQLIEMSVPVVVVVHNNQSSNSEATIIWDNMFAKPDRQPFVVPEWVSWSEMETALNAKSIMITETGLDNNHLMYLKNKILQNLEPGTDSRCTKVSWSAFNKDPLVIGSNFTFWEWFYRAIDIVQKCLKDYWKQNHLLFMSRQTAQTKLSEKEAGTFLIRFSESEVGAVTIAWCTENQGTKEILMLQPWSAKDFQIRGLADRIFDLPELTHLYPNIPKESAFGKFRTPETGQENRENGYVPSGITARILPTSSDSVSQGSWDFGMLEDLLLEDNDFSPAIFDDDLRMEDLNIWE